MIGEINSIILANAIRSFDKLCNGDFAGAFGNIHSSFTLFTANRVAVKEIFIAPPEKMEGNIDQRIFILHNCGERFTRF